MKKLLLVTAMAALSVTAANATPTIYGKAVANYTYFDNDVKDDEDTSLGGYARIGFKGDTPLNEMVDAVYKIEFQYGADPQDSKENVTQRDVYVGLNSDAYGEVLVGRMFTVDDYVHNGWSNPSDYQNSGFQDGDTGGRWNDSIRYTSPTYNDMVARLQYKVEDSEVVSYNQPQDANYLSRKTVTTNDSGSFSASLSYDPAGQPYSFGLSHNNYKGSSVDSTTTITGFYDLNELTTISAGYQMKDLKDSNLEDVNNLSVAASYMYTPKAFTYVEYDYTDNMGGAKDMDQSSLSGGVWYDHTNQVATYAAIGYTDSESESNDGFGLNTGMRLLF